jgi:hypothetical protein
VSVDIGFGVLVFFVCLTAFVHWRYARLALTPEAVARRTTGWDLLKTRQADPAVERARVLDLIAIGIDVALFVVWAKFSVGAPEPPGMVFAPIVGVLAAAAVVGTFLLIQRARDIR